MCHRFPRFLVSKFLCSEDATNPLQCSAYKLVILSATCYMHVSLCHNSRALTYMQPCM